MKSIFPLWLSAALFLYGCSNGQNPTNAAEMTVAFSWETGNINTSPALKVSNVPPDTKQFNVRMEDLTNSWEHGSWTFENNKDSVLLSGNRNEAVTIKAGAVKGYKGPGGSWGAPKYEFTVKAINQQGTVIGIGKKMRKYPEDE